MRHFRAVTPSTAVCSVLGTSSRASSLGGQQQQQRVSNGIIDKVREYNHCGVMCHQYYRAPLSCICPAAAWRTREEQCKLLWAVTSDGGVRLLYKPTS